MKVRVVPSRSPVTAPIWCENPPPDRVFGSDLAGLWLGGLRAGHSLIAAAGVPRVRDGVGPANAGLPGLIGSPAVKFTRRLDPGSLDLANLRGSLRLAGCPHCQCLDTLVGHGFLWGLPPSGSGRETRGVRMWCTDRGSAHGCGRTTSVHWDPCIPHASLRTAQLLELLRARAAAPTRHAAWAASRLSVSLSGAYRWFARWQRGSARLFSLLCSLADPPGKTGGPPDPHHLIHLAAAFPPIGCPAAAFQNRCQIPLVS